MRSVPVSRIIFKFGINPSSIATSKYSGSQPSRQIAIAHLFGIEYVRSLATTLGESVIKIPF
jgi:hypothetical protein